ncbi:arylformamidase [Chungangia koreensis]|uniref:Kynurenine formamidase n=1 Tax=Chungangia koreensis TaxID=752657 RepID=A0ABV8X974_9LACT
MSEWIDITQPLYTGMPSWPGDTPFEFGLSAAKAENGVVNIGKFTTTTHIGTHVDAPFHFDDEGKRIADLDIHLYIGRTMLLDVTGNSSVGRTELEQHELKGAERILLKMTGEGSPDKFPEIIPYLRPDIGPFLKEKGVKLIGIDVPSVDPLDSKTLDAHHSLHRNGVMILENIVLQDVEVGEYELVALPLRIVGADGSPVRAVIRKIGG